MPIDWETRTPCPHCLQEVSALYFRDPAAIESAVTGALAEAHTACVLAFKALEAKWLDDMRSIRSDLRATMDKIQAIEDVVAGISIPMIVPHACPACGQ
jgi:hypothetical protein